MEVVKHSRLMAIMFTDVVNSTGLKAQLGASKYTELLKRRHDGLMQSALSRQSGGSVIKEGTGDGYFLSFTSVTSAVSTALEFQWHMGLEQFPCPFKVRVGIHLGEVEEGVNEVTGRADFVSTAIDEASRTMSLAEGGQILMTRAAYDATRQVLREHPVLDMAGSHPQLCFKAHGLYRFRGIEEPVEVFEIGVEGISPLHPPSGSEKAVRILGAQPDNGMTKLESAPALNAAMEVPKATRSSTLRKYIVIALVLLTVLLAGAGVVLLRQSNPVAEMKQLEIDREISRLRSEPVRPILSPSPNLKRVDLVQVSDNPAFDVLDDARLIDLRGWKEVPPDRVSEFVSAVTSTRKLRLKKVSAAQNFEIQGRTTGLELFWSCQHFPFSVEAQIGESLTGLRPMKVRKLVVDVSGVEIGREVDLDCTSTYWNTTQTEDDQWFGLIGYRNSFVASMLILFPANKPFKTFRLSVAPAAKGNFLSFTGRRIVLQSRKRDWIYWEVPTPESGQLYRLDWTW